MTFKDKFVFASVAFLFASIWFAIIFFLITAPAWFDTILSILVLLSLIGFMSCLRAIGELSLWESEETKPVAEARFKYGHLFRGMWF